MARAKQLTSEELKQQVRERTREVQILHRISESSVAEKLEETLGSIDYYGLSKAALRTGKPLIVERKGNREGCKHNSQRHERLS